jgi:ribosomal protein S3
MCEREIERQHKKENTQLDFFDIQIKIPSLDIQIKIHAQDPSDSIELAGKVIALLKEKDLEPQVEVLGIDY